jgi:hypothetical protein
MSILKAIKNWLDTFILPKQEVNDRAVAEVLPAYRRP